MEFRYKEQLPGPSEKSARAPSVVVVDDDRRVIDLLHVALSGSGYRTFSAMDGEEAMKVIDKVRPDVIVLDVRLPKRNGYQVCEALKTKPTTQDIPVIMISGLVEPSARVQGLRSGADDFLTKPFSPKELVLRIQKMLVRVAEARSMATVSAEAEKELINRQRRMAQTQRRLSARVDRVRTVGQMGRTMAGAQSLEELVEQFVVSLQLCLRSRTVLVALLDDDEGEYKVIKSRGVSPRCANGLALPASGKLCAALVAEGDPMTMKELDGVPGMRGEVMSLRACGLAMGYAVKGLNGPSAALFVGGGLDGDQIMAEDRDDFKSLCGFFETGLVSLQRAESERADMVDTVETVLRDLEGSGSSRGDHARRVARFVESIWESLDLPPYELQDIRLAALVHEMDGNGRDFLRHAGERYDGSGAPCGLRAEQIPLEARILAVADTFDECLCGCGSSSPVDEAIDTLRRLSGTSLDPNLVEALIHHIVNGRVKLG